MRDKIVKSPHIRFAVFTDAWEQRKLGDLGSVSMNKRIFKDETSETGDVPFFKIGTFGGEPDAYISRELFEEYKAKYPYPEIGDILISASGSIGRTVVYQGEDEYFQDSNIVWLKHDDRLDNTFLKQFYSIVKWQGLEGSTIKRLYNKNILETEISVPTPAEQKKIGGFFGQLDNLITLHQRKLELLKVTKKSMLQKMFPKCGESVPEIRFVGFTDTWEQCKFKDVIISELKGKAKAEMVGSESVYLETAYLNGAKASYVDSPKNVEKDDVLILWDGSQAGTVYHGFEGALGSTLKAYKPKESGEFLYQYLKRYQQVIYESYRTPNIPHVVKTFALEFNVSIPVKEEQNKIGKIFSTIDNLITLHQRELDLLKDLKKLMLKQMFI